MCMESDSWGDIQRDAEQVRLPPVQFVDISDKYSIQQDLEVVVEFGKKFVATVDDWVGLFPLGWRTLKQYVAYQWIQQQALNGKQSINIPKAKLPTDFQQYYQFMYVNGNTTVVGISAPFYFTNEELFMDAQGDETELEKELYRRELKERENMLKQNQSVVTVATDSKLTIASIPEESLTSIMADACSLYDEKSAFCESAMSDTEFKRELAKSAGDNPEFYAANTDTMALVPWTSKDELVWDESAAKSEPKSVPTSVPTSRATSLATLAATVWDESGAKSVTTSPPSLMPTSVAMLAANVWEESVTRSAPTLVPTLVPTSVANDGDKEVNEEKSSSNKSRKQRKGKQDAGKCDAVVVDEKGREHSESSDSVPGLGGNSEKSSLKTSMSKQSVVSSRTSSESLEQGSSAKSSRPDMAKDAHLDQVVSRFFNFLGSVIARSESDKSLRLDKSIPCSRCGQLELDLESVKSRAFHAEYREGALVRELVGLRKQVKQQEVRTSELLDHLQLRCDDSNNVEILKGQMTQVLNELQQAAHTIHRLSQEKNSLETKIGNLMWEKAGLCAKLQVVQQGEARNSRRTNELSAALLETQEEMHLLSRRYTETQQFVEALLATLSSLGFSNVKDPSGAIINLETIMGPGLCLEPLADENITNSPTNWTKRNKFQHPEKWYKAIMTSQEIIQQLQAKIHDLEDFCRDQEVDSSRLDDMQRSLNDERKKSKLLESQISQMVMSFSLSRETQPPVSPSFEKTNFTFTGKMASHSEIDLDLSTPGYELLGARPKFTNPRQQLCEPVDELDREFQTSMPRFGSFAAAQPTDNYPQSCPYCGETFPAYLLPNDKQEHIRMHMYSELQRNVSNMTNQ